MVFPSIFANMDAGGISQLSTALIILFSYCLHRWKKIILIISILFIFMVTLKSALAFGGMGVPGQCGTGCMNGQRNYYGAPYGNAPFYSYPQVYPPYMGNNNWQFTPSPYMPVDCVQCRMQGQYSNYGMQYSQYPNMNYGMNNYSNYNYPGAWGAGGINGAAYPGGGHGWAGKPNIYFSGKSGTHVKVKVNFSPGSNVLAAAPLLGQSGWDFKIGENNSISANGINYNYLFYDFRTALDSFQFTKGFCTSHAEVIPQMAAILKDLNFKEKEIADFTEYWTVKLPASEEYCVYPQIENEIRDSVALEITPKPSKYTRVLLFVLPKEIMGYSKFQKYTQRPTSAWTPPVIRTIASESNLEFREWGVGLLTGRE